MIKNPVLYAFVLLLHKQQARQHRQMAAAAAATGKSCGSACAPDKQEQEKQRPPFPLAASVSATGSPGPVAHSSGSAWPCRVRYPSKRQRFSHTELLSTTPCWADAADEYAISGLDAGRPLLRDEKAAKDDGRRGSTSRLLPWQRYPDKGGDLNRKGGARRSLCNGNEMIFSGQIHFKLWGEF